MTDRRKNHVMLRLTGDEHELLAGGKPDGEELAVFARRTLLAAVRDGRGNGALRQATAFIVAALSPDIGFEEALTLYDEHAGSREEVGSVRH